MNSQSNPENPKADDVSDSVKTIKKFFGAGTAIAAFLAPILLVLAFFRRPN